MLKVSGKLINFIDKSVYKKDDGLEVPTKAKLQIIIEETRANGSKVKSLKNISIPDSKISLYRDKIEKVVEVEVGIISKEYNFYGV